MTTGHRFATHLLVAATTALAAGTAAAQTTALPPRDPRAVASLILENDSFSPAATDRWYTSGVRLGWQSAEDNLPAPVAWLDQRLAALFGPARTRWGLGIQQTFFTPRDLLAPNPSLQDRPYAAVLNAELSLDRRTATTLDRFAVAFGAVGPFAQGKGTQDLVHDILGDRQARGWHYQVRNEPIINLYWDRTWRVPIAEVVPGTGVGWDLLPNASVALGNANVNAGVGARLRFGQNLGADFGPPRIRPAIGTTGGAPVGQEFGWYLFGGAGGRVVGLDVTINGNNFRDSRGVDQRPLVGELELGGAVFWRGIRLSYTHVWRSEEFVAQPKPFQFGSIALSAAF